MDPVTIGAVGWSVAIIGWVASAAISKLLGKGFDYLGYDVSKRLQELEQKVLVLERVMEIVEASPYKPRLEELFQELKSAFYEAEDILDAVEYHRLKKEMQDGKRSRAKKLWSTVARTVLRKNMESGMSNQKLMKSLKKIEGIVNEGHQILEKLGLSTASTHNRMHKIAANSCATAASPEKVIGRDDARDMIIAMLHEKGDMQPSSNEDERCYSVIGIHGIGGSGKSTLAQFVCAQEKKEKKEKNKGHFDLLMWVDVSQNFSADIIWKKMFEAASDSKVPCPEFNNLDVLRQQLEDKLDKKRFFLVLDDVLCKKDAVGQDLPLLLSPLNVGKRGSKILVTTRNKNVLPDLGPYVRKTFMPVPDFHDTAFLELFMYYALEDDQDRSMTFHNIGAEIAKKLKRSPLAARIVGGNLRQQQEVDHWITVKNQDLFSVCMGPLWWSYYQLSEQARRCFAYCSIFPRRRPLYRDDLVKLWMAEGFVGSTNRGNNIEDVGQERFNELVSTSFLQLGHKNLFRHKEYYLVHDLLYDLAERVAGSDCFRIENGYNWSRIDQGRESSLREVPQDVRHLSVQYYDETLITGKVLGLKNLRTLIIYHVGWSPVEKKVIESICKRLKKLRVLAIASGPVDTLIRITNVDSFPESISELKHLRYLAFRTIEECRVSLPSALTELYYMQLLDFGECEKMKFPSTGLINLQHVLSGFEVIFPNVGRLLSLKALPHFTVRNEQGYELKQLRDLDKLRGLLRISGLERVKSKEEALDANLAAKERLTELQLVWGDGACCNQDVAAEVLEGLCPPAGLQTLRISQYQGSSYPDWMHNGGPKDLQRLMFWDLPHSVRQPAPQIMFPHLRVLKLANCRWDTLPGKIEHLTSLKKLRLFKCMNIRSLPTLPLSLGTFSLTYCEDEFTNSCQTAGHPNWEKLKHVPITEFE